MSRLAAKVAVAVLAGCLGLVGAGAAIYELVSSPTSHSTPAPANLFGTTHAAAQFTPMSHR